MFSRWGWVQIVWVALAAAVLSGGALIAVGVLG